MREPLYILRVCRGEEWVEVSLTGGVSGKAAYQTFISWPYDTNLETDALKVATSWYPVPQRNISTDTCALEQSIANDL